MVTIQPKLTSSEALTLCQRLHKKFNELDYDRAFNRRDFVQLDRCEVTEVVEVLKKLEERLQWSV